LALKKFGRKITLMRVEITLERVFGKIERVLAKIYLKIDTQACECHTQTCHFHTFTCLFLRVESTRHFLHCARVQAQPLSLDEKYKKLEGTIQRVATNTIGYTRKQAQQTRVNGGFFVMNFSAKTMNMT
jgi:hypothetical protein